MATDLLIHDDDDDDDDADDDDDDHDDHDDDGDDDNKDDDDDNGYDDDDDDDDDDVDSDDDKPILPHEMFTARLIKHTKVHFRLRRTIPNLWRHEATCFLAMRVFGAIDDSRRIAAPGVNWKIGDRICTVLVVACLGYSTQEASRSAKISDTSVTEIILRDAKHTTSTIKFSQMYKVSSHVRTHAHTRTYTHTYIHTHTHHIL